MEVNDEKKPDIFSRIVDSPGCCTGSCIIAYRLRSASTSTTHTNGPLSSPSSNCRIRLEIPGCFWSYKHV
jgi:hypothetical protein